MNNKLFSVKYLLPTIIFIAVFIAANPASAKIYRWTDSEGNLNYSDIPPKDIDKADLIEIESVNNKNSNSNNLIQQTKQYDNKVKQKLEDYQTIKDHNSDEDVSPMLQKLKTEQKDNSKSNLKSQPSDQHSSLINKNCTTAQNNLASLQLSKIILDNNKKLHKLTNTEYQQKIAETISQVEDYCWSATNKSLG